MGVMRCSRVSCENIMCDKYSHEFGFICNECFDELLKRAPVDIEVFMNSPKREEHPLQSEWELYLNETFKGV